MIVIQTAYPFGVPGLASINCRPRYRVRQDGEMSDHRPIHSHAETIYIEAPLATVWELVTAMDRYGEWSSENEGG